MVSRSIAGSRPLFSEKCRKENGMCSVKMNQKFDLEGKEDVGILSEIFLPRKYEFSAKGDGSRGTFYELKEMENKAM